MKATVHKAIRTGSGVMAFVSFLLLIGSMGAIECETVSISRGIIQGVIFLAASAVFTWMAGGFEQ